MNHNHVYGKRYLFQNHFEVIVAQDLAYNPRFEKFCKMNTGRFGDYQTPFYLLWKCRWSYDLGKQLDAHPEWIYSMYKYEELMESLHHPVVLTSSPVIRRQFTEAADVKMKRVLFYSLDDDGNVIDFKPNKIKDYYPKTSGNFNAYSDIEIFNPESLGINPLNEKELVYYGRRTGIVYRIAKQEVRNNTGVTFSTDHEDRWIKIFDQKYLNTYTEARINTMLKHAIEYPGICWPMDIVQNQDGCFCGYVMKPFKGMPLSTCVFDPENLKRVFPDWSHLELAELARTLMNKIDYLHAKNVMFGSINPAAIRVVDQKEVYFTDTDNYQVEGFVPYTYNDAFTPPELIGKNACFVTRRNELFSVAELIFMTLMPGRHPYATDTEIPDPKDISEKKFPYAGYKKKSDPGLPKEWISMWESMGILRKPLYETFQEIQKYQKIKPWQWKSKSFWKKYSRPTKRKTADYWKYELSLYINRLKESDDHTPLQIDTKGLQASKAVDPEDTESSVCGVNADFTDLHEMTVHVTEEQKLRKK